MTDRELLELAAKAAGLKQSESDGVIYAGFGSREWNPLNEDGDALQLAVDLRMDMYFGDIDGTKTANVGAAGIEGKPFRYCIEPIGNDPQVATRRAIVRAAAEIGRLM